MLRLTVALMLLVSGVGAPPAVRADVSPDARCKDRKGLATGVASLGLLKAFTGNTKKPNTAKLATDLSKAHSKLTKGFTKAEYTGRGVAQGCETSGAVATLRSRVDAFVSEIVASFPLDYRHDVNWLCRPGLAQDECLTAGLDATAVLADNSFELQPHQAGQNPEVDCFYVYPTVDLSLVPANHTDFSDRAPMRDPLLSQAARFNRVCRIFAPLYRQVTLGTFASPNAQVFLDVAFRDVDAAFSRYLEDFGADRNFIIMGHSQGTFMLTRLIQERIDPSPELRSRLVAALLIGGSVFVPDGQLVGGSFQNIPLCAAVAETGCVVAYRTYAEGYEPAGGSNIVSPAGTDTACTNPAAPAGGASLFEAALFPTMVHQPLFAVASFPPGVSTPFVSYPAFYEGECVRDADNRSYLEIRVRPGPGDVRTNPVNWNALALNPSFLGTHILDYNFAMADLLDLVEAKIAATSGPS
jgi:hypothetical protein